MKNRSKDYNLRIIWAVTSIFPLITYLSGIFLPYLFLVFISDVSLPVNLRFNLGEPGWISPLLSLTLSINNHLMLSLYFALSTGLVILYLLITNKVDVYALFILNLLLWIGDIPAALALTLILLIIAIKGRITEIEISCASIISPATSFANLLRIRKEKLTNMPKRELFILTISLLFVTYHILTNLHFRDYTLLFLCWLASITLLLIHLRKQINKFDVFYMLLTLTVIIFTSLPSIISTLPIIYYDRLKVISGKTAFSIPLLILSAQCVFLMFNPQPTIAYNPKMITWLNENLINYSRICSISEFTYPIYIISDSSKIKEYFLENIDNNITSAQWIYQLYGPETIIGSKVSNIRWFPSDIYEENILTLYQPEYVHLSIIRFKYGDFGGPLCIYDIYENQTFKICISMNNLNKINRWSNTTKIKLSVENDDILVVDYNHYYSFTIIIAENYTISNNEKIYIRIKASQETKILSVNIKLGGKLRKIWYIRNPPPYWVNYEIPLSSLANTTYVDRLEVNVVGKGKAHFDYIICDYIEQPAIETNFLYIIIHNLSDKNIKAVLRYNADLVTGGEHINYLRRRFNIYHLNPHSNLVIMYDSRVLIRILCLFLVLILTLTINISQVIKWIQRRE